MDVKITLSFDAAVIASAKEFAEEQGISLSRLTEFLYRRITSGGYQNINKLPISEWVNMVAEGPAEYQTKKRGRKALKEDYFNNRK